MDGKKGQTDAMNKLNLFAKSASLSFTMQIVQKGVGEFCRHGLAKVVNKGRQKNSQNLGPTQ